MSGRYSGLGDIVGDIHQYTLILWRVGNNVVFKIEGRDIPIVHRVLRVHER